MGQNLKSKATNWPPPFPVSITSVQTADPLGQEGNPQSSRSPGPSLAIHCPLCRDRALTDQSLTRLLLTQLQPARVLSGEQVFRSRTK